MGYVDPDTVQNAASGAPLQAARLDADRAALEYIARNKPHFRGYNAVAQSIPNNTRTAILLGSERFDVAAMHSASLNTSRATVPAADGGKFFFGGGLEYAAVNTTGVRQAEIFVNGTTLIAVQQVPAENIIQEVSVATFYAIAGTGFAELTALQTSGGALNANGSDAYGNELWACWMAV